MGWLVRILAAAGTLALAGSPVIAADAPLPRVTKAPAVVTQPVFDWSGFYAGGQFGYGWGKSRHIDGPTVTERFGIDGWLAGGTIGFNWQFAPRFVVGVEADLSWSNVEGRVLGLSGGFGCSSTRGCLTELDWLGTARVRAGAVFDRSLAYVTGGLAYGEVFAFSNTPDFGTKTRSGWTAGAGWEYAPAPNWSAKLEYLYVDLGEFEYNANGPYRTDARFHMVRAGLNYRFATGVLSASRR